MAIDAGLCLAYGTVLFRLAPGLPAWGRLGAHREGVGDGMRGSVVGATLLALACAPAPPRSLDDVDLPDGFVLDTHRDAVLVVVAEPPAPQAFVTVATPTDGVRFEGPLATLVERDLRLRLSPADDVLRVTVRDATGSREHVVELDADGHGVLRLEAP